MRIALVVALVACSSKSPKQEPESHRPADTGAVSEEAFKAMHEPPTEAPKNLKGQTIDLAGGKAYLSLPAGTGPFPAIIVIHEWWGLNGNIEHWADRFAAQGWAAVAVDLYNGTVATTQDGAMAAMKSVDEAKAGQTISAAIDFVKTDPRIAATRRVVVGWCFGGGWSMQTALAHPELDGAIIYYGQLETDPAKLSAIKARVLGIFGTQDKGIPPDTVAKFEDGLKAAKVDAKIYSYDAPHAFANPSNPKYVQGAATEAWGHVLELLDQVKASPPHADLAAPHPSSHMAMGHVHE
jgi:carboxymethylenebutenolidase